MCRIALLIFFAIKLSFFLYAFAKIFVYGAISHKKLNSTGIFYGFAMSHFLIYSILGSISLVYGDKYDILSSIKSFILLAGLVYLAVTFYKMATVLSYKNSITRAIKKYKKEKLLKSCSFFFAATLMVVSALSVGVFSSVYIKLYDMTPIIAIIIFVMYLFFLMKTHIDKIYLLNWVIYMCFLAIFLMIKFIEENTFIEMNMICIELYALQLLALGFLTIGNKELRVIYD